MAFPSITWTPRTPPAGYTWNSVVWIDALTRYMACGYKISTGEGAIAYSPTGVTWIVFTDAEVLAHVWYDLCYHDDSGRVVVVGGGKPTGDGLNPDDKCITSDDAGATWVVHDIDNALHGAADSVDWGSVVALPSGRLVAGAAFTYDDSQPFTAYSDDGGDNWTGITAPSPYQPAGGHPFGSLWGRVAAKTDGSRLVIPNVDADSGAPYSDDEGVTWTNTTMPASSGDAYGSAAAWSPTLGVFGIAGLESGHESSVWTGNGSSWTNRFRLDVFSITANTSGAIAWIPSATPFFLVGGNPTSPPTDTSYLRASEDGVTWFDSVDPATTDVSSWVGIAYSPSLDRIVMVSNNGDIVTGDLAAPEPTPDGSGTGPAGGFTDGFNYLIDSGFGTVAYRLMIESWPEEFVTDSWITHADNKNGRKVYTGLTIANSGARRTERITMQRAQIQADGLSFKVRATDGFDRPLQSFSNYPTPIAKLDAALGADDTAITTVPAGALTEGNTYHLGTEAVRVTSGALVRHIWDSLRQSHFVSDTNAARATYVYRRPLTMQGLRAYLFAYGDRDDGAGDGSLIWRGTVNRPPRRDRDGKTWLVETDSITKLLMQNVAGSLEEAHPVGIYHHQHCCFAFRIFYDGTLGEVIKYSAWDPTEETFVDNVNALIEAERVNLGISQIESGMLKLAKPPNENAWTINVTPNANMPDFAIAIGSPIVGTAATGSNSTFWTELNGNTRPGVDPTGAHASAFQLRADTQYHVVLERGNDNAGDLRFLGYDDGYTYDGPPVTALGYADFLMAAIPSGGVIVPGNSYFYDSTSTLPANRIYVDTDLSSATSLSISDTFGPGIYIVTGSGVDGGCNYIEVSLYIGTPLWAGSTPEQHKKDIMVRGGFNGFLSGGTTINSIRNYVTSGSLIDFVAALKTAAVDANLGDTPQITDADLTTWAFGDAIPSIEQLARLYAFVKKHTLEEVLAEECKFVMHFIRLALDGRIELKPLPTYAEADDVDDDHVLDVDGIVTPPHGSFPGYDPQRDGIATTVEVSDSYDFRTDDWTVKPFVYDDPNVIATHKGRGKTVLSIKPYSIPASPIAFDTGLYRYIADAYLGVFGLDYTVIPLEVTIRHYRVLCGNVVRLRHHEIPAGDGTKGMVDRLGVVIGRSVPIDITTGAKIQLDVLVYLEPVYGYAPSFFVTDQTDNGGDEWAITCDPANAFNIEWSGGDDGRVLDRIASGFKVRVVKMDSDTEVSVTGTVVGTPDADAGTMVVQFDGTWTPGANDWRGAFQRTGLTAAQLRYAVVAAASLQIYDGNFARRLG